MKRLVPNSLFARLALTLIVLLTLVQILSAVFHLQDRGELLYHAARVNSVQRIAGIVQLLDSLPPGERERAARALSVPPMGITLDPVTWPDVQDPELVRPSNLLKGMLQRRLGHPVDVRVTSGPPDLPGGGGWMPRGMHRRFLEGGRGLPPRWSFLVRVELGDGDRITFDYRLPEEMFAWPWRLLASLGLLLVSTILISFMAVRWITRPLSTLAAAADGLGRDIQRPPLAESGPTEVRRAAAAFNRMQERLQKHLSDRSRVLAAVSHDLKTPITRLRLRAEFIEDPALQQKFLDDLDDMETMVRGTLDLVHGLEHREAAAEVDINALLDALAADYLERGTPFSRSGSAREPYRGRPLALKRCLTNLIDNASRYGTEASVTVEESPGELAIIVSDHGPGLAEAELERVFEPFYRVEQSRSRETGGSGLGLSISRNIARTHGGELVLRNREGGGLEARLSLPRGNPGRQDPG